MMKKTLLSFLFAALAAVFPVGAQPYLTVMHDTNNVIVLPDASLFWTANAANAWQYWGMTNTGIPYHQGSGVLAPLSVGSGLSLSNGVLTATSEGSVTSVGLLTPTGLLTSITNITDVGTFILSWENTFPTLGFWTNVFKLNGSNLITGTTNEFTGTTVFTGPVYMGDVYATSITFDDAAAARTALGLGSAATNDTSDFQAASVELGGLAGLSSTGLVQRTGAGAFSTVDPETLGGSTLPYGLLLSYLAAIDDSGTNWTSLSPHELFVLADSDFLYNETWEGTWYWSASGGGTKGRLDVQDGDPWTFGLVFMRVGTASSSAYSFFASNDQDLTFDDKCVIVIHNRFRAPQESDNSTYPTNVFELHGGLDNRMGNTYGADMVKWFWSYTNTLNFCVSSNATRTWVETGIPLVSNQLYQVTVVADYRNNIAQLYFGTNTTQVLTNVVAGITNALPLDQYTGLNFGINKWPQASIAATVTMDWHIDYIKAVVFRKE